MKFQRLEITNTHNEHERFVLHIGRKETEILISLLHKARMYMPKVAQTTPVLSSVGQMEREFRKLVSKHDCERRHKILDKTT